MEEYQEKRLGEGEVDAEEINSGDLTRTYLRTPIQLGKGMEVRVW